MSLRVDPAIPVAVICNIAEAFYEFLIQAPDSEMHLRGESYRGDRAVVWLGTDKLVITSLPIPHADYLAQHAGYSGTVCVTPQMRSHLLSRDIMHDPTLLEQIKAYAGDAQTIQLVPYTATREFYDLVDLLRNDYGLNILLPETNERDHLWLRDYIDTKEGFRILASRWLHNADELILEGVVCRNRVDAAEAARWFVSRGEACIVKNDIGENGFGNVAVRPGEFTTHQQIFAHLSAFPQLGVGPLTVEALVGTMIHSPSFEAFVPPADQGEPYLTYVSDQLFQSFGDFIGVIISRELQQQSWYTPLVESGLTIARHLQTMGYVGFFDLDAIVDESDLIYLLEVNTRRTGGTHTHDFGSFYFGENYVERVALLSDDTLSSGVIRDVDALHEAARSFLYPMGDDERGAFITGTSALESGEFGAIIVGRDTADCKQIQEQLVATVCAYTIP